ncbi:MAG TPA: FAD-dependent oxidoreductase [Candidatus Babeliales bacterium]|nr:FAD-dependent oxidoreductase [Candidatus Babeliales bacterium]
MNKKMSRLVFVSVLFMQGCRVKTEEAHAPALSYDINSIYDKQNVIPFVVIGSGPAGLGAALYGARDNVKTVVLEGDNPGGLLMLTTDVANWPGQRSILGPEIIKSLREQVQHVGAEFLADTVISVDLTQWPFAIKTANNRIIHALTVIITTGASPRKLGVPGEQELWGRGVTTCAVCDAHFYKGEDVVVIGGGDSAIEEAMQLANHVKTVTILVRKDRFRAASSMQARIKNNPAIKVLYNVEVTKILGENTVKTVPGDDYDNNQGEWEIHEQHVTGVEIYNNKTKETSVLPTAGVFLAIGHVPNSELFKGSLALDNNGYIKTIDRTQQTSIEGVYTAGEVEDHRYRQAGVSFGDGTKAALDALAFLREIGFDQSVAKRLEKQGTLWEVEQAYEMPSISTEQELQDELEGTKLLILDFWADDCPACLQMLPVISRYAKKNKAPDIKFFKVDAKGELDTVSELVTKYDIRKIPCLLVFIDGKLVARHTGAMNENELAEYLKPFVD